MAKTSSVEKNNRRRKLTARDAAKRKALKAIIMDQSKPLEERFRAQLKLSAMPRNGAKVRVRVADQGDPGNRATTKMVCTAALTLLQDPDGLPGGVQGGGVLTPASGLGQVFVERLRAAGMTLEVTG